MVESSLSPRECRVQVTLDDVERSLDILKKKNRKITFTAVANAVGCTTSMFSHRPELRNVVMNAKKR